MDTPVLEWDGETRRKRERREEQGMMGRGRGGGKEEVKAQMIVNGME